MKTWILGSLTAVLFVFGANTWWSLRELRAEVASVTTERDSLAGDAVRLRLKADGWEAEFANATGHLWKLVFSRDSVFAADLRASGVRIRRLTQLVATLEGQVSSVGVLDTVPGTWTGGIDDGLLTASWGFSPPNLSLDYAVSVPIELVEGEAGDGRTLVLARGLDPRVSVTFSELLVNYKVVVVNHCPVGTRLKWGSVGMGFGFILGVLR